MNDRDKPPWMRARKDDPWVSVSLLGECVFCDRAGRFQYEESQEDTGEEEIEPPRRGWFRPPFSVEEIENQLRQIKPRILVRAVSGGLSVLVAGGVALAYGPRAADAIGFWIPTVAAIILAVSTIRGLLAWVALAGLLAEARAAGSREPDPRGPHPQRVTWWSLVQCGFAPHRYQDPLSDEDWRVTGKPWRILHRGSVRIPVFRKRNEDDKLYRQHYARIAAYAHLIETSEGAEVPYGIILLGSSYHGLTVAVERPSRRQFYDATVKARGIIKSGAHQPGPENPNRCRSCRWGKPMTEDRGSTYQSPCGERYGWVPPHQKAIDKGLRR